MSNLNEVKVEGTIVSKVSKTNLESGLKIANFVLKTDGEHPVYILVKFVGKKQIELEKDQHVWLKGSLGNIKKADGTYELGIKASAYKIHENKNQLNELNSAVDDLLGNSNEEYPTSSFKGVGIRRRR